MSLHHSFDIEIARKYGVNVALFLDNLAHWTERNIANSHNFYDGTFWSYNTQQGLLNIFSYWSRQTLRTTIDRCDKEGLILKGNYNKTSMDKTTWYAFSDKGMALYPALERLKAAIGGNQPMEGLEPTHGVVGTNQAIPDTNTYSEPNTKSSCRSAPKKARSQKPKASPRKTKADYEDENRPHDWAPRMKVCEPVTEDPVQCGGCKRTAEWCTCNKSTGNSERLPPQLAQVFSKMALSKLKRSRNSREEVRDGGMEKMDRTG